MIMMMTSTPTSLEQKQQYDDHDEATPLSLVHWTPKEHLDLRLVSRQISTVSPVNIEIQLWISVVWKQI